MTGRTRISRRSVTTDIKQLVSNLRTYRSTLNSLLSAPLVRPRDCRAYLRRVHVCTSQLYLDTLLIGPKLLELRLSKNKGTSDELNVRANVQREKDFRRQFKKRIHSRKCWKHFAPETPFSELTGLRTAPDYLNNFALHLPEIHEETFRLEQYAKRFLQAPSDSLAASILVSLQHLGRNHISFVLPALQWVTDESTWSE